MLNQRRTNFGLLPPNVSSAAIHTAAPHLNSLVTFFTLSPTFASYCLTLSEKKTIEAVGEGSVKHRTMLPPHTHSHYTPRPQPHHTHTYTLFTLLHASQRRSLSSNHPISGLILPHYPPFFGFRVFNLKGTLSFHPPSISRGL